MNDSPFLVAVADVARGRVDRRDVTIEAAVDWKITLSQLDPTEPLVADLTLTPVSGGILVRGTVDARVRHTCHRCLDEVSEPLEVEVAQLVQPVERADEDDDYTFAGDDLDLEPLLRDEALLAMPLSPLCGPDCPGLVAAPETDLNDGSPDDGGVSASPFAVLQDWFRPDD